MQHKKKRCKKFDFFLRKKISFASQMFIFEKLKKSVCKAVRLVMVNEIKHQICFIYKIMGGDRFPAGPPKSVYFLCNLFSLRVSEKVLKQTMFRTA